jgi:outer membrane protein assembly factor BamD (BamD/ComL family)
MKGKISGMLLSAMVLTLILGCASLNTGLSGKEKLEAKDWLHAGDVAYQIKDYDNAQYFYEKIVKGYPDTYYAKKAQENLGYVSYQKGLIGRTVQKTIEIADPVIDDPVTIILNEPNESK